MFFFRTGLLLIAGLILIIQSNSMLARTVPLKTSVQDDTVAAVNISSAPTIDGAGNDECWQNSNWQTIDQVWIPYGGSVETEDYSGRYKIIWSSQENLLYFLVEITDDAIVDGYIPTETSDNYNFDIIEVFIDEDKSGGFHIFDDGSTNAENAFSYHIYADCPSEGEVTTECHVGDIAGTGWGDRIDRNYADHFPEFSLRKTGNIYTREFSLKVYNDTYDHNNPENSRVVLNAGKIMGISLAYCDNDGVDEPLTNKTRDNFFGSVWVTEEAYNDHWQNADDYGNIQLVNYTPTSITEPKDDQNSSLQIFPNPAKNYFHLEMNSSYMGPLNINIYNILGQKIFNMIRIKTIQQINQAFFMPDLITGIYFLEINYTNQRIIKKFLISK